MWINDGSLSGLHPQIGTIITAYFGLLEEALSPDGRTPDRLLEGFYLYGSLALGDYSLALSDIDVVAVTKKKLSGADIALFGNVHRTLQRLYPKPNMDVLYVTADQLGKLPQETEPYPYFHDGRMAASGYFESNLVTWHELKQCGIAIVGKGTSELLYETDMERLLQGMIENLRTYWRSWIDRSSDAFSIQGLALLGRDAASWGVLGIARQYYTFRERAITTKTGAGAYLLTQPLGAAWQSVIDEAIRYRNGEPSTYRSPVTRRREALACMEAIYRACEDEWLKSRR